MSDNFDGVLHIGAPKCGSSALQSALSMHPCLVAGTERFCYVGIESIAGRLVTFRGEDLKKQALRSPYGYLSWPNLRPRDDKSAFWVQLERALAPDPQGTAIVSCEGWIAYPKAFAHQFKAWGHPRLMIVAYVRPPLDWLNSAYWQWGIWTGLTFAQWYERTGMSYKLGTQLQAWNNMPNIDLRIHGAHRDVVQSFGSDLQVAMPDIPSANRSSPPALIGFLLRNRKRFRPSAHSSSVEFVVQRWCTWEKPEPLWALSQDDVLTLRGQIRAEVDKLFEILPAATTRELGADPSWTTERPYHDRIRAGRTALRDISQLSELLSAMVRGVQRVCQMTGRPQPMLPVAPGPEADLEEWDAVVAQVMTALLHEDAVFRGERFLSRLQQSVRYLFKRSR